MNTERLVANPEVALRALRESEARYSRLLSSTTDYIYSVKMECGVPVATSHGPGCSSVTGYSSQEFETDPHLWLRIIHEEDRSDVISQISRIHAGEVAPPLEHRILRKDGVIRWIRNTLIVRKDEAGQMVSYDGHISDITERKRAEQLLQVQCAATCELAKSGTLAQAMASILKTICETFCWEVAAFWSADEETQTLHCAAVWHRAQAQLENFSPASEDFTFAKSFGLPGRVWETCEPLWIVDIAQDDRFPRTRFANQPGLHTACGFPLNRGPRTVGVVELFSRWTQSPDTNMMQVLTAVGTQISQYVMRKDAEAKLDNERKLLRTLVDHLPVSIYVKDFQGRFLMANPAHLQILGAETLENLVGKTDFDYFTADSASRYRADEVAVIQSGQPLLNREEMVPDAEGRERWVLSTKVPFLDKAGATVGLVGISLDITDRKKAEESLSRAHAELSRHRESLERTVKELRKTHEDLKDTQLQLVQAAKLESVGTLAAGVAHEVKNPLQTILMGLDYLDRKLPKSSATVTAALQEMREAVQRANSIVSELLQLSAAKEFCPVLGDLNGVIERALWLLRNDLVSAHMNVSTNLAAGLPLVPMDARKLEQAFINLFLNALQAMAPGGTIRVASRSLQIEAGTRPLEPYLHRFSPGEKVVVAQVTDTGPGIPEKDLARIFDPFFTTKPPGCGTGLGLAVVRTIVKLHGGVIWIGNSPEGGALATVVLKTERKDSYDTKEEDTRGGR